MSKKSEEQSEKIRIKNIRSSLFRHIHADGVVSNISPSNGNINLNVFSQRFNIPEVEYYDFQTGEISRRDKDFSVIREYETSIFLGIEDCRELVNDLKRLIEHFENTSDKVEND